MKLSIFTREDGKLVRDVKRSKLKDEDFVVFSTFFKDGNRVTVEQATSIRRPLAQKRIMIEMTTPAGELIDTVAGMKDSFDRAKKIRDLLRDVLSHSPKYYEETLTGKFNSLCEDVVDNNTCIAVVFGYDSWKRNWYNPGVSAEKCTHLVSVILLKDGKGINFNLGVYKVCSKSFLDSDLSSCIKMLSIKFTDHAEKIKSILDDVEERISKMVSAEAYLELSW